MCVQVYKDGCSIEIWDHERKSCSITRLVHKNKKLEIEFVFVLFKVLFVFCFFLGGCGPDCSRQWNCTFVFRTITPNQNNRWIYLKIKQILGNGTTTFVGPQFFLFDFTGATRTNSIWHWGQGTAFSWI